MDLFGVPVTKISSAKIMKKKKKKKIDEFIANVDENIRIIVANDNALLKRFNDELNIIANKGFHFTLARVCCIPKSKEAAFMTDDICESFKKCSFYLSEKAPVGSSCPFEIMYIKQLTEGFIESMKIDPESNFMDMQTLMEYVTYALNFFRASRAIAASSMIMMTKEETKFGTNYIKATSYYNEIMDTASRHMARIKKEMVATRESRLIYKLLDSKKDPKTEKEKGLVEACYSGDTIDMIEAKKEE